MPDVSHLLGITSPSDASHLLAVILRSHFEESLVLTPRKRFGGHGGRGSAMLTGRKVIFLWGAKFMLKWNAFPSDSWNGSSQSWLGYFLFLSPLNLFFFPPVEQMHSFGKATHAMSSSCLEQSLSHSFHVLPHPEEWYCLPMESPWRSTLCIIIESRSH